MLAKEKNQSLFEIEQTITQQNVNAAFMTTRLFVNAIEDGLELFTNMKQVLVGGEFMTSEYAHKFVTQYPDKHLIHVYGPTETTTFSTCNRLTQANTRGDRLPIGAPLADYFTYVLDAALNPLAVGLVGELYIAGSGLARGYLGRAGLTAERFVANPFAQPNETGSRMYRSGDLARWTEDGVLEYLGRVDAQVKIRGFRIELGEIETTLLSIPGIAQCTVQARGDDGAKQLVAYLVGAAETTTPEASTVRALLSSKLPDYMVPAAFVVLESLPLTINGKLDVRALPSPEITSDSYYRAPETWHEQLVASLFAELTGATRVGLDDSFFALGGHSLLAMRMISQVRARTGLELALRKLFEQPTVAGFSQALEQAQIELEVQVASGSVSASRPPILKGQGVANPEADGTQRILSYGQIRLWTLAQIEGATGHYNMPAALKLSGALQSKALELALTDVINRHEPLRTVIANIDGQPVGYVQALDHEQIANHSLLALEDLSALEVSKREAALEQIIARDSTASFDLSRDLMVRARLIKLTDTDHVLTLVMHHIAGDGVSMSVFCKELTQAYQLRTNGQAPDWVPLSVSYADHAAWQRAW